MKSPSLENTVYMMTSSNYILKVHIIPLLCNDQHVRYCFYHALIYYGERVLFVKLSVTPIGVILNLELVSLNPRQNVLPICIFIFNYRVQFTLWREN